jgi:hypothetical protein
LQVQAFDNGKVRKKATARVRLEVLPVQAPSANPPKFPLPYYEVQLMENCKIGEVLDVYQAEDIDGNKLSYSLTGTERVLWFTSVSFRPMSVISSRAITIKQDQVNGCHIKGVKLPSPQILMVFPCYDYIFTC